MTVHIVWPKNLPLLWDNQFIIQGLVLWSLHKHCQHRRVITCPGWGNAQKKRRMKHMPLNTHATGLALPRNSAFWLYGWLRTKYDWTGLAQAISTTISSGTWCIPAMGDWNSCLLSPPTPSISSSAQDIGDDVDWPTWVDTIISIIMPQWLNILNDRICLVLHGKKKTTNYPQTYIQKKCWTCWKFGKCWKSWTKLYHPQWILYGINWLNCIATGTVGEAGASGAGNGGGSFQQCCCSCHGACQSLDTNKPNIHCHHIHHYHFPVEQPLVSMKCKCHMVQVVSKFSRHNVEQFEIFQTICQTSNIFKYLQTFQTQ